MVFHFANLMALNAVIFSFMLFAVSIAQPRSPSATFWKILLSFMAFSNGAIAVRLWVALWVTP